MTASSTGKLSQTYKVDGNIQIGNNNVGSMNSNKDVKNDSDTGTFSFDNTIATNSNGVQIGDNNNGFNMRSNRDLRKLCHNKKVRGNIQIGDNNSGFKIDSNKDVKKDSGTGSFSFGNGISTHGGFSYRCSSGYLEVCPANFGAEESCPWKPAQYSDLETWKRSMKKSAEGWEKGAKGFEKKSKDFETRFGSGKGANALKTMKEFQDNAKHSLWKGENCKIKS
jgi:hypothetical protein